MEVQVLSVHESFESSISQWTSINHPHLLPLRKMHNTLSISVYFGDGKHTIHPICSDPFLFGVVQRLMVLCGAQSKRRLCISLMSFLLLFLREYSLKSQNAIFVKNKTAYLTKDVIYAQIWRQEDSPSSCESPGQNACAIKTD